MQSNKTFQIEARTVCLGADKLGNADYLLKPDMIFHIPIFQRPYSWGQPEIEKFIIDLFNSFWGISRDDASESLFIGTMQLTEERHSDELGQYFDVIDGQQRLTTFMILIRVFQLFYPSENFVQEAPTNWLRSSVSNGAQQGQLNDFLQSDSLNGLDQEKVNRFKINAEIAAAVIAKQITPFDDQATYFKPADFIQHLFTNVYFVVIQTRASLTKTLQIFKAINTTGLDLNGEDIFKLRMFEYLKDRNTARHENEIFQDISSLYTTVENKNKEYKWQALSMSKALSIYKYILIQRLRLPKVLYEMGTDTFFENLFDAVSRSAQPEHFSRIGDPGLTCGDINDIIDAMIKWEDLDYPTTEDECLVNFVWYSRYGRFDLIKHIFLYQFRHDQFAGEKIFPFLKLLTKVYWCYSVIFQRRVYHLLTWTYNCLDVLMAKSYDDTLEFIRKALFDVDQYGRNIEFQVGQILNSDITDNYRKKTLICRLSAMLDEQYFSSEDDVRKAIVNRLFGDTFDVEHIQSAKDSDLANRPAIAKEWENEINTIGNLVALEMKINRSIGNKKYELKKSSYKSSEFTSIARILTEYPAWTRKECKERLMVEKKKIMDYVFG